MYWTHIIQGKAIQFLILKPNADEQVILSTLIFITGLLQACLFWKRTVLEINFYPKYLYLWEIRESVPSPWGSAIQSSQMPKEKT